MDDWYRYMPTLDAEVAPAGCERPISTSAQRPISTSAQRPIGS